MAKILLSVAVITFNQEKYISQTMESILDQQHNYAYEIIVGDDCSSDNTKKIIEQYATRYPEIIKPIYNDSNLGIIRNYFNVISHCSGKYIMECAGDDYWLPDKVSTQIEFMENNPDICMCHGNVEYFKVSENKVIKIGRGGEKETLEELIEGNCIYALTTCFRKDIVDEYIAEIKPLEKGWLTEDYPMWLYFARKSKIKHIDKTFAVYREFENSASHSTDDQKIIEFEISLNHLRHFFAEKYNVKFRQKNDKCIRFDYYYYRKFNREECGKIDCSDLSFKYKLKVLCSKSKVLWLIVHRLERVHTNFQKKIKIRT